jgi:hypothetical protein
LASAHLGQRRKFRDFANVHFLLGEQAHPGAFKLKHGQAAVDPHSQSS